jgi:hypothetical protein
MTKNNSFLFTALLLSVSCSERTPKTLISQFEIKNNSEKVLERALASSDGERCLQDIFTVETLKNEIQELETKYKTAPKRVGSWKHLDLSTLPVPQGNFLKTYGADLGDLNNPDLFDYSSCEDVPCIFNKIYGKENHVAGYVHYLWYLKFGNMLAADNKIPVQGSKNPGEYNKKIIPFEKYLLNDKELYAFWRLSLMLRSPHTTLSYLKEVQRIPRGEALEGYNSLTCGLAYSSGWILLSDACLSVNSNIDTGYFYQAVTHELTHHVDYEQGRGSRKHYRSHKEDYLEMAGFHLEEYVDDKGKPQRKWAHKDGIKLISDYAGTAPEENFAESISYFRVNGDETKKGLKKDHYDFISKEYYSNLHFESESLMKKWISQYQPLISQMAFSSVMDCSKEKSSPKSIYFKPTDFNLALPPQMLNCISEKALEISKEVKVKTKLYEPEGCNVHQSGSSGEIWDRVMREILVVVFDGFIKDLKSDSEYLKKLQKFYEELSDKSLAREAYIFCYEESEEPKCYTDLLKKKAAEKVMSLNLAFDQADELVEMYHSYHPYEVIKNELKKSYHTLIQSQLESVKKESLALWRSCEVIKHNDDESPSGTMFQVSDGYMISSFFNCLNSEIPETIKNVVRGVTIGGLKVQNAKEEVILYSEVKPVVISQLKEIYKNEREKEAKSASDLLLNDQGQLRSQIISSFDWVKNVVDNQAILSDCKKKAYELIKLRPLFHLPKTLFSDYLEKNSCLNISTSKEFSSWLDGTKGQFSEKISAGLDEKMLALGTIQAKACVKQFPVDSAVNKIRFRKEREACLINQWPELENNVLKDVLSDPLVIKFQVSQVELKSKLDISRRRLQLRLMKEYFN